MKELSKTDDTERLSRIEEVLRLMDIDKDGNIELEHALKVTHSFSPILYLSLRTS